MSTQDFAQIQLIRRLIKAGRYKEARSLLRDMHHPQVPVFEHQLDVLIRASEHKQQPKRRLTRFGLVTGLLMGCLMLLISLLAGINNVILLVIGFALSFLFGTALLEIEQRRESTYESLRRNLQRRHRD